MGGTAPIHDFLIASLIEIGKIRVDRDEQYRTLDTESGLYLPTTRIHVRDDRNRVVWPAVLHPNSNGYPRLRVMPDGRAGRQIWLFAHRISWVAEFGPTQYELDHKDRNYQNFNLWNLVRSNRFIQMANRKISKADAIFLEQLRAEFEAELNGGAVSEPWSALEKHPQNPF